MSAALADNIFVTVLAVAWVVWAVIGVGVAVYGWIRGEEHT